MISPHDTRSLIEALTAAVGDMVKERDAGRIARGEIMADNRVLRDQLAKTDATLMALCQALDLDPTGDPVAEVKARRAAPRDAKVAAAGSAAPLPLRIAMEVWPGAWTVDPQDDGALSLVLADPISLISAEIEAVFRAPYWRVRLNNRNLWTLLAQCSDLAEALTIARDRMRQTVADLAKGVG